VAPSQPVPSSPAPPSATQSFSELPISAWTIDHTAAWLDSIGYSNFTDAFKNDNCDGAKLLSITPDHLKTLGVAALGVRKEILRQIAAEKTRAGIP
jgi:predicted ATP-grasp superfamily ATP-dependent carboligase